MEFIYILQQLFSTIKEPLSMALAITTFGMIVASLCQTANIIMGVRIAKIKDTFNFNKFLGGIITPILYAISALITTLAIVLIVNGLPFFNLVIEDPTLLNTLSNSALCLIYITYSITKIKDMLDKHKEFLKIKEEEN